MLASLYSEIWRNSCEGKCRTESIIAVTLLNVANASTVLPAVVLAIALVRFREKKVLLKTPN